MKHEISEQGKEEKDAQENKLKKKKFSSSTYGLVRFTPHWAGFDLKKKKDRLWHTEAQPAVSV